MAVVTVRLSVVSQQPSLFHRLFVTAVVRPSVVLPDSLPCSGLHSWLKHTCSVHFSLYVTTIDVHVLLHAVHANTQNHGYGGGRGFVINITERVYDRWVVVYGARTCEDTMAAGSPIHKWHTVTPSYRETLQWIDSLYSFIDAHRELCNAHTVDFFTCKHWESK